MRLQWEGGAAVGGEAAVGGWGCSVGWRVQCLVVNLGRAHLSVYHWCNRFVPQYNMYSYSRFSHALGGVQLSMLQ